MAIIVSRATSALVSGTGTITTSTSSTTVTGVSTLFTTEVDYAGKALYTSADEYIGIISSITSNTVITLVSNALVAVSAGAYKIGYLPKNAPLSNLEIDTNFINLNNNKMEITDTSPVNLPNTPVRRDSSGNFAAGTITATINGTASALVTTNNYQVNSLGVGTAGSGTSGEIRATNAITSYYSDSRLKTFEGTIPNALAKVLALNGYYFVENAKAKELGYDNDSRQVGVSAQEVEAVLPEVVASAPINNNIEGADYKTVHYEKLVPLLIEAIKEMNKQIEELKGNR
jgi:hypothetical protein